MVTQTLERRETTTLIGSDKVEGTNVYRSNGDKIGSIERIMLDKMSGKVAYAVMSFGGFLGIGHEHYPVPWSLLKYNTSLGGYEVNISENLDSSRSVFSMVALSTRAITHSVAAEAVEIRSGCPRKEASPMKSPAPR